MGIKDPVPLLDSDKVFIFYPGLVFVRVSSFCPLPKSFPDVVVNVRENFLRDYVLMVICPAPNLGVESFDQIGSRFASLQMDCFSDIFKEGFHSFLARFYQEFISVFPNVCSEKVKSFSYVRNFCFL